MDCGADVGRIPTVTICGKILELLQGPDYGFDPGVGPDLCPGPLIILLTLSLHLSLQTYAFGHQRY